MIFTATIAQATTVHQSPAAPQITASSADQTRDPPAAPIFWIPEEGSGWINFEPVESGHIIIPVVLNGEPVRALIDTGVETLTVSKAFADAHHLPLTPWGNNISVGGPSSFYLAPGFKLDIGAIRTTTAGSIVVEDLGSFSDSYLGRFDVVIGLSLLRMMEWQVDQDQHRVRMLRSGTIPIADGNPVHTGPGNARLVTDIDVNSQHLPLVLIDTGSDDQLWLSSRIAGKIGFHAKTDMAALGIGGPITQQIGHLSDLRGCLGTVAE